MNKHIFFSKLRNRLFTRYPYVSYSRSGEDIIFEEYFQNQRNGFYIDIGAYHPINFSNSYKYYLKGWRGINIDPSEEAIKAFKLIRPLDINLQIAVGDEEGEIDYFSFSGDDSMNTVSKSFADAAFLNYKLEITSVKKVPILPLAKILNQYLPVNTAIDFFSIDVEGYDLKVLKSNDWTKYRPKVVCVELAANMYDVMNSEIVGFMEQNQYVARSFCALTDTVGNIIFTQQ